MKLIDEFRTGLGKSPEIEITEDDFGAIYFSSGTTGFPKAILHKHRSLTQAAEMEQKHHATGRDDNFLCIPPLYHTGAKFHWMGSLVAGSKAVLLKGAKPENNFIRSIQRAVFYCMASCAMGTGYFRWTGQRRFKTGRLSIRAVEIDAYRCTTGSPEFD